MPGIIFPDYIKCRFNPDLKTIDKLSSETIDVFFAETADLYPIYNDLIKYISYEEMVKAERLVLDKIRQTYILSHALLRLHLGKYLKVNPLGIIFNYNINAKPGIDNDPVYFNLSHTDGAFAFALSPVFYVGIDIEKIDYSLDIKSIVKSFFSKTEQEYIFSSDKETEERFFLLWTRKESLLKALGTGIVNDLNHIEVSGESNIIKKTAFDNLLTDDVFNDHYIFSTRQFEYYISLTAPCNPIIDFHHLKANDLTFLLT